VLLMIGQLGVGLRGVGVKARRQRSVTLVASCGMDRVAVTQSATMRQRACR
jgi:hypothetical protein